MTWPRMLRGLVLAVVTAGVIFVLLASFVTSRDGARGVRSEQGTVGNTQAPPAPQAARGLDAIHLGATGLDSDGWLKGTASVELTQPDAPASLVMRGVIPLVDDPAYSTELRVVVDGKEAVRQVLGLGDFELRVPSPAYGPGQRRVELRFSATQRLPAPDSRQVAARLKFVGFEVGAVAATAVMPTTAIAVQPSSDLSTQRAITDPHTDLANAALAATGLDGDGWLAGTSALTLNQPATPSSLVVRGMVPMVADPSYTTELRVVVDGQEVAHQALGLGEFELRAPAPAAGAGQRRVELHFSTTQQLPAPDGRHVGARLQLVGFEGGTMTEVGAATSATSAPMASAPAPPRAITDPHTDLANPALQATGLDGDRWLAGSSSFTLFQPGTSSSLVVRGMVPLVADPAFTTELRVLVDGQEVARQTLGLGEFELRARVPAVAAWKRRVELRFSATQQLPAPDTRQVGARIQLVGFEDQ